MKEKLYSDIEENIRGIRHKMDLAAQKAGRDPKEVELMAVTKTVPPEIVNIAIQHGITLLGENRAQELTSKIDIYHKEGVEIHFIGSLQSNKVRQVIDHVTMIQSLDRLSLAKEIEKQAKICDRVMDVLIQVNVGKEETKSGVFPEDTLEFAKKIQKYPHLRIRGLMSIPPPCDNKEELEGYFTILRQLLVDMKEQNRDNGVITVLSMGMSGDYETAIEQGATIVRIGSGIFGARN